MTYYAIRIVETHFYQWDLDGRGTYFSPITDESSIVLFTTIEAANQRIKQTKAKKQYSDLNLEVVQVNINTPIV